MLKACVSTIRSPLRRSSCYPSSYSIILIQLSSRGWLIDACGEAGVHTCEWHNAKGCWFDPPSVIRQVLNEENFVTLPSKANLRLRVTNNQDPAGTMRFKTNQNTFAQISISLSKKFTWPLETPLEKPIISDLPFL